MKEFGRIMSIEEYHSTPDLSNSGIGEMQISPFHYWAKYRNPKREPFEMTPSLRIGSAFHFMIGEPDLVSSKIAGMPDGMIRRGKDWDHFRIENDGKIILSFSEMEQARDLDRAMRAHPIHKVISKGSIAERSYFWTCPVTGATLKTRPDIVNVEERSAFDFKTIEDITDEGIRKSFHDYGYRIQAALGLDGLSVMTESEDWSWYNVFIEKKYPHCVRIVEPTERAIADGRRIYQTQALIYKQCEESGIWPSFPLETQPVDLPAWYKP